MKTLLFVLLLSAFSVQDTVEEHVRLSKIKDLEEVKSNIKRVAPPYVNFEPCGEYLVVASRSEPDKPKMIYYQGKDATGETVVKYAAFRGLAVEIDNSLETPEVVLRAVMPPKPTFIYRMSQKDYETMPCLPKPEKK